MSTYAYSALLDVPAFPAERYGPLADRLKSVLDTQNDVVFVQAEAILALEAAATSLGRPGLVAVNIVTSPYGGYFGDWLRCSGATVETVLAENGRPVTLDAVRQTLDRLPKVDLVAIVHAETSSGIINPLPAIAELVRAKGALLVVDAVASVGGHALDVDALGIDLCVIGAQKALGGPAGLSMLSVSPRAWQAMLPHPAPSSLALLDLKHNWLDRGRGAVPGMPSAIEFWALDAALDRVEAETLAAIIHRHAKAARATRRALTALGVDLWIKDDAEASTLATAIIVPDAIDVQDLIQAGRLNGATLTPAFGSIAGRVIRLDHTGPRAHRTAVLANLTGLSQSLQAQGLNTDLPSALKAAVAEFDR